jgi:hypothetical protein
MDDRGSVFRAGRSQFRCLIWDFARLTLVIAICGVQHDLVGDLHGAGVVGRERVLGRQSPMCPESKIVTISESMDLCDQLISQPRGWLSGEHWFGLPRLMDRTVPRSSLVGLDAARFDGGVDCGRGFDQQVGSIEIVLPR